MSWRRWLLSERAANVLLGLSFPLLGVAHVVRAEPSARMSPVLWTGLALAGVVGVLFWRRAAVRREPGWPLLIQALPALAVPLWADAVAPSPALWPFHAQIAFTVGGALTLAAFVALGPSFAVLPAVRRVVTSGPYRVVRHPAYAGELIMVTACLLARPSWVTLAPLLVGVPLVGLRIAAEEHLLRAESAYQRYRQQVRWRLLPLVW